MLWHYLAQIIGYKGVPVAFLELAFNAVGHDHHFPVARLFGSLGAYV
jgi:hypothetical protein